MRKTSLGVCVSVAMIVAAACGGTSPTTPTSPTAPTAPTTPTPTPNPTFTMTGGVSEASPTTANKIPGATVTFTDGSNAGMSATTDGAGNYSIGALKSGGFNITVSAPGYQSVSRGVTLSANSTQNFSLLPVFRMLNETLTGSISGGDATCSGGDGVFTSKPCKVTRFNVHNDGALIATLDWSPNRVADLDL